MLSERPGRTPLHLWSMEEGGDGGLWFSPAEPSLEGDRKQNPVLNEPHGLFYAQSCLLSWADIPWGWILVFLPHGSQHNLYKHLVVWANVPLFAFLRAQWMVRIEPPDSAGDQSSQGQQTSLSMKARPAGQKMPLYFSNSTAWQRPILKPEEAGCSPWGPVGSLVSGRTSWFRPSRL